MLIVRKYRFFDLISRQILGTVSSVYLIYRPDLPFENSESSFGSKKEVKEFGQRSIPDLWVDPTSTSRLGIRGGV